MLSAGANVENSEINTGERKYSDGEAWFIDQRRGFFNVNMSIWFIDFNDCLIAYSVCLLAWLVPCCYALFLIECQLSVLCFYFTVFFITSRCLTSVSSCGEFFLNFFLSTQVLFPLFMRGFVDNVRIKSVEYNINNVHILSFRKIYLPGDSGTNVYIYIYVKFFLYTI